MMLCPGMDHSRHFKRAAIPSGLPQLLTYLCIVVNRREGQQLAIPTGMTIGCVAKQYSTRAAPVQLSGRLKAPVTSAGFDDGVAPLSTKVAPPSPTGAQPVAAAAQLVTVGKRQLSAIRQRAAPVQAQSSWSHRDT
jgi:hypothetical protein